MDSAVVAMQSRWMDSVVLAMRSRDVQGGGGGRAPVGRVMCKNLGCVTCECDLIWPEPGREDGAGRTWRNTLTSKTSDGLVSPNMHQVQRLVFLGLLKL